MRIQPAEVLWSREDGPGVQPGRDGVMSFLVLPPEVNSALMLPAGSRPDAGRRGGLGQAPKLNQAANSFSSATAALAGTACRSAATAMAAAAALWLSTAATRA